MKEIDPALLDILVCPRCRGGLTAETSPSGLVCPACKVLYEIREGIPILLIDQAKPLTVPDD